MEIEWNHPTQAYHTVDHFQDLQDHYRHHNHKFDPMDSIHPSGLGLVISEVLFFSILLNILAFLAEDITIKNTFNQNQSLHALNFI